MTGNPKVGTDSLRELERLREFERQYRLGPEKPSLAKALGAERQAEAAVARFAASMKVRLIEKLPVWGFSWRDGTYTNAEVIARLRRAVDHLEAAFTLTTDNRRDEITKRAADVGNQAMMAADPERPENPR